MNRFGDSNCRGHQGQGVTDMIATGTIAAGRPYGRQLPKMATLLAALLALGGCSWFSNDEPAFPPSSGGPNIAAVPNGLPGDGGNAEYSDQELRALLGSAPRPLPPAPAAPKAADTGTPDNAAPAANASTTPAGGQPAPVPAGTVPAAPVPDTTTNNANGYPDINTVPMQRPTPVPDPDQGTETKPKQSSMLQPAETGRLQVLTTAGSSPAAPSDLAVQTAQSTGSADDSMFSKPALPPYTGYDQTQKQPQGVPGQALYHSPYGAGGQPVAGTDGSLYYASQSSAGGQMAPSLAGQPVGLVYFGIGSTALAGADRQVLHQIAELQRAYGGVIRIVGHASSRTENMPLDRHHQANADIAQARAKAVAQALVRYGVKPLFVQIAGVSDTQPLYPEIMPAGESANRRAEIYLSSN
ncbi:MAG TPA: OmpA family protein [Dongiaceae bacterium]|nr:OmpA family protein [Dongiaceae bacterium]